jgi:hypothetical protein
VFAAEHVERQVAIAVVLALKEAAFLAAVDRVVGGVQSSVMRVGALAWASI